jgi:hypothetical protein
MKRVIYTIFMNHFEVGDDLRKYDPTFNLTEYFPMMAKQQRKYAEICQADYKIFGYGQKFKDYVSDLKSKGIFETPYQAIQHYKFFLAEELKNSYDEILYLDLDVYPNTEQSIFDKLKAERGIATHGFHLFSLLLVIRRGAFLGAPLPISAVRRKTTHHYKLMDTYHSKSCRLQGWILTGDP